MGNYTLLRNVEAELHSDEEYVVLTTLSESGVIRYEINEGAILINTTDVKNFCEREDVSLSKSEKDELLAYIEDTISQSIDNLSE